MPSYDNPKPREYQPLHISTITELINGSLLNTPSITLVENTAFLLKDVRRGSLFFAKNQTEAAVALGQGAYGVVFDFCTQMFDTDSALIRVASMQNAILRYLRYFALNKKPNIFLVSKIELEIIKALSKDSSIKYRDADLSVFAKEFIEMADDDIFVSDRKDELETINKDYKTSSGDIALQNLKEGLFSTEFICFERCFRLDISSLFLPELKNALFILRDKKIKDEPITGFQHFRALYVNKNLQTVQNSERALIIELSTEIFLRGMEFLDAKASWAKRLYLAPKTTKLQNENIIFYEAQSEIFDILTSHRFNFALILKDETFDISFMSANPQHKPTLF